jgi:hypothetical protein
MGAIGGGLMTDARAVPVLDRRLTIVEQNFMVLNQKLDDIIQYERQRR